MTPARSIFRRFGHVRYTRRLLALGPARGNRLCIPYARSNVASIMSQAADPDIARRCVAAAKRPFLQDERVGRFASIYEQLDTAV